MDLITLDSVQLYSIVLSAIASGILIGYYSRTSHHDKENNS